jgi:hypothetical protein
LCGLFTCARAPPIARRVRRRRGGVEGGGKGGYGAPSRVRSGPPPSLRTDPSPRRWSPSRCFGRRRRLLAWLLRFFAAGERRE